MPLVGIRKRVKTTFVSAIVFLAAVAALLAGCAAPQAGTGTGDQPPGFFPLPPVTDAGDATSRLYDITFLIAVIVFVLVEGLLIYISLRFRQRHSDTTLPTQTHGSNPLEILWTIIPAIVVTGLFIATLVTLTDETEARAANPSVVVDVTGFQWQWTFDYPAQELSFTGTGSKGPVMALPVGEPIRIRLHGLDTDVIHSFYVPQFLYKKDVVPGRVNEFDVTVRDVGTYFGQCAEFCGLSHADMVFSVQAMTRTDFDAWVAEQQQARPSLGPPPSGAPSLSVSAVSSTAFDPTTLSAPADQPIAINFINADPAGQPHNVAIQSANPDGSDWNGLPIVNAGQSATYVTPPLAADTYEFYCAVHPTTMRGTLNVGGN